MIIHINGWPGVGKKTIGELVANKLNARFIHNHVLHDVSFACAGIMDKDRWPLYEKVRAAAYEVLERRPHNEIFVMTNALCKTDTREIDAWRHVVDLAMNRNVPLVPIVLHAEFKELKKRITSPTRTNKLTDPVHLREMIEEHELLEPAVPETLIFDVSKLSAEDAATAIVEQVLQLKKTLGPVSTEHFNFR